MKVKVGSKWVATDGTEFVVISVTEVEGHIWVFYRRTTGVDEPREYSCYEESFLSRFRLQP